MLVEDMFYNVPARQKAIRSGSEEHARILDMVGRYAVFATRVGITVKRAGEARPDLHTTAGAGQLDAIRRGAQTTTGPVVREPYLCAVASCRHAIGHIPFCVASYNIMSGRCHNNDSICVVQGRVRFLGVQASPCVRADRGLRRILATR